MRLAAEDLPFTGGGPVADYSEGAYAAVACHDYPTLWDPAAPLSQRRSQLDAARAGLDPATYAPFPNRIWLRSLYIDQTSRAASAGRRRGIPTRRCRRAPLIPTCPCSC